MMLREKGRGWGGNSLTVFTEDRGCIIARSRPSEWSVPVIQGGLWGALGGALWQDMSGSVTTTVFLLPFLRPRACWEETPLSV